MPFTAQTTAQTPARFSRSSGKAARLRLALAGSALLALAACGDQPMDFDLRGKLSQNKFDTSEAARNAVIDRPDPDSLGVISYPTYQVAVAQRGDTLTTLAARVGADVNALARFNGIEPDDILRKGEIVALPRPVAAETQQSVTDLASGAIDSAAPTPIQTASLGPIQTGPEPTRHTVERGETAYTIARLYDVPVRALADWNGLGVDYAVREGQKLIIPVTADTAPTPASSNDTPRPGSGTPTPTPPSAAQPLPDEDVSAAAPVATPAAPDLGANAPAQSADAAMVMPVTGRIIRAFSKGKNDGIDIGAAAGTAVKAADAGTVGHVTSTADQAKFIVIKHAGSILTVYLNVEGISVQKGDRVSRGQTIAKVADTNPSFLHFEVRDGTDAVDPMLYLK
ncbi:peptidoglycan DD-metalloendopeptidase family protein [Pseudaestuariivita sp.]|uniref:peptidoglycan DD-metalloendopeptidase family protein n=1 Tax=Pseudaestuariivita sp. TaxID=2211669 RepID=UPI0040587C54